MKYKILKTLNSEYLCRIHEPPRRTPAGLYVVRAEYEKTFCAVVEVLPDDNPHNLNIGDVIIFDNYSGRPFDKDEKLILLKSDNIIAKVEQEDK
jgi:co-chaperonin GroES (HSP10)